MRPELRPKKLTRRSASPSEKVFRMIASVSLAGMECRRADAAPDDPLRYVRFARIRGTDLITTHPSLAQCLHPSLIIFLETYSRARRALAFLKQSLTMPCPEAAS